MSSDLLRRITIERDKRSGRPCIRGLRITVTEVLALLASGMSRDDILRSYPDLEMEDFDAALMYAVQVLDHLPVAAE